MALDEEIEDLKKLSPEERIKRLKEIETKRKEEIEKAETLIRESELQIKDEGEFRSKVPIDEVQATDISTLGSASEDAKNIWKTAHQKSSTGLEGAASGGETSPLEKTAEEAPIEEKREAEKQQGALYQSQKKAEQGEMYGRKEQEQKKMEYEAAREAESRTKGEQEEQANRTYVK